MKKSASVSILAIVVLLVVCGSSSVGHAACVEASGTWNTTEQVDARSCDNGTYSEPGYYTVTQQGCTLQVNDGTETFNGSISNNNVIWTGSYYDDGGTVTATIDITVSGNSLSGSASWTWSDGFDSCSGTTSISGTRTPVAPDPGSDPDPDIDLSSIFDCFEGKSGFSGKGLQESLGDIFLLVISLGAFVVFRHPPTL